MYSTETPALQRLAEVKRAIVASAESRFHSAGIPFRAGRIARLVGKALTRHGHAEAEAVVLAELDREARALIRPRAQNAVGVIDTTGATAAAREDARREVSAQLHKKNAPVAVAPADEGGVTRMEIQK